MMVDELRIGNYVTLPSKGTVYQISSGHDIDEIEGSNDAEPIPITDEWLECFGFRRGDLIGESSHLFRSSSFFYIHVGVSELHINPLNGVVWIERDTNKFNNPALIDHVHQLQNLYFALTGKELKRKRNYFKNYDNQRGSKKRRL